MLLDKFQKITGARRRIDCNAVLTNIDAVGEKYLKRVACSNGEIKKVSCVLPIPKSVNEQCREWFGSRPADREEAYFIKIGEKKITIYSNSRRAALYAANRIKAEGAEGIAMGAICNYPDVACRMIKLYLPSEENIPFFKELIDLCVYYGYNTVMLEVGGAMEYHSHPEINEGWRAYSRESSDHINHRGKNPYFPFRSEDSYYLKNSIHCENAGGGVLTKERVRELVQYCKERYLEVIPEVPSFSHSDYLLTRHHELAERQEDMYPDAYCPSNPESYRLLFDIMEEIIAVFAPKRMNIGHDEAYSIGLCEKCRTKDAATLYAEDIKKIYCFKRARRGDDALVG